jgi:hypothetical protein
MPKQLFTCEKFSEDNSGRVRSQHVPMQRDSLSYGGRIRNATLKTNVPWCTCLSDVCRLNKPFSSRQTRRVAAAANKQDGVSWGHAAGAMALATALQLGVMVRSRLNDVDKVAIGR